MAYHGSLTLLQHREMRDRGVHLRVFVRGADVTNRCQFADDTPGDQIAVLYRENAKGDKHFDEDGYPAMEIAYDDVEIKAVDGGYR